MSYQSEVLADSPAVYWRLNETSGTTAIDSSGNARSGTYTGTYTLGQTSLTADSSGKSVALVRGTNGGVVKSTFAGSVTAFTLEGWVRADDGNGAFVVGRDDANVNANRLFWLWINGTMPQVTVQYPLGSGTYVTVAAPSVTVGTIHYLATTYDGVTIRLYVDGAQSGTPSTAVSGTLSGSATVSSGGVDIYGTTTGRLQDVAYYPTALSPARVSAHYQAGLSTYGTSTLVDNTPLNVDTYGIAPGLALGAVDLLAVAPLQGTAYALAGTSPCPPSEPAVPTTGQIWPRGNP